MEDKKIDAMMALVENLSGAQEEMLEAVMARYGDKGQEVACLVGKLSSSWASLSFVNDERCAAGNGSEQITESLQFAGDMMLAHGVMEFFHIMGIVDCQSVEAKKAGDEFLNSINALTRKCIGFVAHDGSTGSM